MNVASLELCKELYELSGWHETDFVWADHGKDSFTMYNLTAKRADHYPPAYDLGYLLRKLPIKVSDRSGYPSWLKVAVYTDSSYQASYGIRRYRQLADTPENATAKLAIELLKQGILPTPQDYKET
jgi:hypothetical protein